MHMTDSFFAGVEQVEMRAGEFKVKLPIFYRDTRGFACVFAAPLLKLRRLLPDRRLVPAQMAPGVGAVQIGAFEHLDTDVGPYNEVFIAPVLNSPDFAPLPAYNMIRQLLRMEFCTYLHHVPVSTGIALNKTESFFGCGTSLASIEFTEEAGWTSCEARSEEKLVLRLRGRRISAPRQGVMKDFVHTYQQGQPQRAEVKVNMRGYALSFDPRNGGLELGQSHPLAVELRRLLLSTTPVMYLASPAMQMILYGLEVKSLVQVRDFVESRETAAVG